MKKKLTFTVAIVIFLFCNTSAQTDNKKWSLGVNSSTVFFSGKAINKVKDKRNSQFPSIQISRNIGNNLSIDLLYTFELIKSANTINEFNYSSFDAYLKYNFPVEFLKIIPFAGVGLGYIEGATTTPNPQSEISLNFMAGGTLWVSKSFGLSSRLIYKNVSSGSESMASHIQGIVGLLYSFDFGGKNKRIWEKS